MWVATQFGFFSAVANRNDPQWLLIRSRTESDCRHLATAISALSGTPVDELMVEDKTADYQWRVSCSKSEWIAYLSSEVVGLDYDNFKGRCSKTLPGRSAVLHRVWSAFMDLQEAGKYKFSSPYTTSIPAKPRAKAEKKVSYTGSSAIPYSSNRWYDTEPDSALDGALAAYDMRTTNGESLAEALAASVESVQKCRGCDRVLPVVDTIENPGALNDATVDACDWDEDGNELEWECGTCWELSRTGATFADVGNPPF